MRISYTSNSLSLSFNISSLSITGGFSRPKSAKSTENTNNSEIDIQFVSRRLSMEMMEAIGTYLTLRDQSVELVGQF